MPFVEINIEQEEKELEELLKNPKAKKAYDEFEKEYEFRRKLAEVRKTANITQKEMHEKTGLPQQSISRIEKSTTVLQSPTLRTLLKYVDAMGYELTLVKK